jgi:cutinase
MKIPTLILTLYTTLTTAYPADITATRDVEIARELDLDKDQDLQGRTLNLFRNDLEDGSPSDCPSAILIYARGSTEPGNMGITVGPVLTRALESEFDSIWIQGVSSPYDALISPNLLPKGTNQKSINEAKRLFRLAHSKCPGAPVVTAGYSQGSAVVGNALTELDDETRGQVVGAALFGYTKNLQNGGAIKGYPRVRTAVFCEPGDAVCWGTLFVLPGHLLYLDEAADEAPEFLAGRIRTD